MLEFSFGFGLGYVVGVFRKTVKEKFILIVGKIKEFFRSKKNSSDQK
jgi:hypothetical protein